LAAIFEPRRFGERAAIPNARSSSLAMRNVTIQGSNAGTLQELHDLVALLQSTKLRPIPLHGRPISDVNDVLKEVAQGRTIGRIVLEPLKNWTR
jgi:D-arabinose 1-dehydrogenase-like Zn-dependent alcohol dehydrogenase